MEKFYRCNNVMFRTRHEVEEYTKYIYEKVDAFAQIRYINKTKREMTPLEKKKHKMKQRLDKMQEDFE